MDDLEEKITQVLNDPAQMEQIMAIAKSLGFPPPGEDTQAAAEQPLTIPPQLTQILSQASQMERRQDALLRALKPFLQPSRQEKIDKALQVARISQLAGYALKNRSREP